MAKPKELALPYGQGVLAQHTGQINSKRFKLAYCTLERIVPAQNPVSSLADELGHMTFMPVKAQANHRNGDRINRYSRKMM